jgi:EmrB/QacA subfamily drug resistance transporter
VTRSQWLVTAGILLGIFMASMEGTVVATAMPTIVGKIGGLGSYSWVFSGYMLAATTTLPIYGKLSDIYGRRRIYAVAMILFLLASVFCGLARSMPQLIVSRIIQGLGAGGVLPLAFIIVGAMFTLERRARMQGLFASVWGISSIVGPLLGGFLVDRVSWPWVFYVNLVPGALALALIWVFLEDDSHRARDTRPPVDVLGATVLTAAVVTLLLGLFDLHAPLGRALLAVAAALLAPLIWIERRAHDPIFPVPLFRDRLFLAACGQGLGAGWAVFGSIAFVPLFVQAVLGTSATEAGATLIPLSIGWPIASITGSRLLLRVGHRPLAIAGMSLLVLGTLLMSQHVAQTAPGRVMLSLAMMGLGMGFSVPSFMIAVQSTVERRFLGAATATIQFSRSIGGALGISVMGAVLAARLATGLRAAGANPSAISIDRLLDPLARSDTAAAIQQVLKDALTGAVQAVFVVALLGAALGLGATILTPGGRLSRVPRSADLAAGSASVAAAK